MDRNLHLVTESKVRKRTRRIVNLRLKLCAQRALAALIKKKKKKKKKKNMEAAPDFGTDFELQMRE